MGKYSVNFKCRSCAHCCTEVVCLPTPWDVCRIIRETGADPHKFLEFLEPDEVEGVYKNDPTWLEVNGDRYMMALRRGDKGCHFLNKRTLKCKIYESRPLLCRLYPFKVDETREGAFKGFSLHKDVGCPKHRDGVVEVAPLFVLYHEDTKYHTKYDRLAARFNNRDCEGKKPEDFIEMVMEEYGEI